jgi:glutaconyl-CoA/methylmalonyl-CoA decarboxylase subunit gamma
MSQHVLRIGGREYRAEIRELTPERATVVVDGTEYAVDLIQLGRRKITIEPARQSPSSAMASVPTPSGSRPAAPSRGEGGIVAPMPGLVLAIRAKEGESVTAGQTLLVMEAMKMENAVTTPYAGTVTKVYVREGDAIAEGDLLVDVSRPKLTTL